MPLSQAADLLALDWDRPSARTDGTGRELPSFKEWFARKVEPGQHVGFCGPTGSGKTTFWCGILPVRRYVLALDPKGGDSTLRATRFPRLEHWPPPYRVRRDIDRGRPARFILGARITRVEQFAGLSATFRRALDDVFAEGGWTVYVDELQLASQMMGLKRQAETLLIAARDKGVSFFSSWQDPANVPVTASSQARWFAVTHTRDRRRIERLAEMAGRDYPEMRGYMSEMRPFSVALFSSNPHDPVAVTIPKKVS